ncbi:MAG TPA: HAD-IIB family hydrolase [Limnochordia bacterium]|nr:HAD-IIB family hydrolase [Limnochordia bacterium]
MKTSSKDFSYGLLISDIDGTIMDHQEIISPQTKQALNSLTAEGIGVTLATGRNYWEARGIVKELNIKLPVILANGAQIYDFTSEQLLYADELDIPVMMNFLRSLQGEEDTLVRWYDGQQWVSKPLLELLVHEPPQVVQRLMLVRSPDLPSLVDDDSVPYWIFRDGDYYEFTPKSACKGAGLAKLCSILEIEVEQVVALGNDPNDCGLLEKAGIGFVVADGNSAVFPYADGIVASMKEHPMIGIAQWMLGNMPWERIVMLT